ncbi:MAG TPA: FmdB family zinc ribbon protein [Fodinibius sp.]|nr:FmdB family zinc ribbon protein [Fodinibius sp.]
MPTYEYKREDGSIFEIKQSINDDVLETCPETGQKVKRIISGGGGVVYKGDGWYVTDYKDGDRREKRAEAAKKASGKDSSATGTNESKSSSTGTETATTA